MRNNQVPKTIQKWIDDNQHMIDEYWLEQDGYSGDDQYHPYSIWCYLKKGWWNPMQEVHCIHEYLVKDFMDVAKYVERCHCEQCERPAHVDLISALIADDWTILIEDDSDTGNYRAYGTAAHALEEIASIDGGGYIKACRGEGIRHESFFVTFAIGYGNKYHETVADWTIHPWMDQWHKEYQAKVDAYEAQFDPQPDPEPAPPVKEYRTFEVHQLHLTKDERDHLNKHGWGGIDDQPKIVAYRDVKFMGSDDWEPEMWKYWTHVANIRATGLEDVFHVGNMGPEDQIERLGKMHSVSVGDIVEDDGTYWMVEPCGFKQIDILVAPVTLATSMEQDRVHPCKYGHNDCAIVDGGHCFDEYMQQVTHES